MSKAKNKIVASILTLLCAGGLLASCDDVIARPNGIDSEAILTNANNDTITYNTMGRIYDAIVTEGDTNSAKVLNNILFIYSESMFGKFYGEGGLYEAGSTKDATKLKALADKYAIYGGDAAKVLAQYYTIYDQIMTSFLAYVKNNEYSDKRSIFYEKKFYDTQIKAFYKLGTIAEADFKVRQVVGDLQIAGHYSSDAETIDGIYFTNIFVNYQSYIQDQLIPEIYRTLLVSQYLYGENYLALGNGFARKVKVIKLANNAKFDGAVKKLFTAYSADVIAAGLDSKLYGYDFLGELYKGTGTILNSAGKSYFAAYDELHGSTRATLATKIYADAGWTILNYKENATDATENLVTYAESVFGGYIADYKLLIASTNRESESKVSTIRSDFTNKGAYTELTGLHIKQQALIAADETKNGWFTSGTMDTLSSDYQTRLFKGTLASGGVDHGTWNATAKKYDSDYDDGTKTWTYKANTCGVYAQDGAYRLTKKNPETNEQYPYILDDTSKNYYLCTVEEAVNSSKLTSGSSNSYDKMDAHADDELYKGFYTEYIARQIAYSMSSSETYKTSSNQHWVEKMAVTYHDTTIYNYFLKTFPDLFD
jgi:hypothetical protein